MVSVSGAGLSGLLFKSYDEYVRFYWEDEDASSLCSGTIGRIFLRNFGVTAFIIAPLAMPTKGYVMYTPRLYMLSDEFRTNIADKTSKSGESGGKRH